MSLSFYNLGQFHCEETLLISPENANRRPTICDSYYLQAKKTALLLSKLHSRSNLEYSC